MHVDPQEEFALLRESRELSRSSFAMSRQSSERQTAASTPFPPEATFQVELADDKVTLSTQDAEDNKTEEVPNSTEAKPPQETALQQLVVTLPKLRGWQLFAMMFLLLLPAMFYKVALRN